MVDSRIHPDFLPRGKSAAFPRGAESNRFEAVRRMADSKAIKGNQSPARPMGGRDAGRGKMLKDLVSEGLVQLRVFAGSWEQAIELGMHPLLESGCVEQ